MRYTARGLATALARKVGASLAAAFVLGSVLTACGSDNERSSGKSDGSSVESPSASAEDCRAKQSTGDSSSSDSEPREASSVNPVKVKFGETVRAKMFEDQVDITASEATVSTGKLRQSTGPGTPCMVKLTIVGIDSVKLDNTDFEARSDDREKFDFAHVDNNLEDETVEPEQKLDGAVSFLVPKGKTIAEISLKDVGEVVATWSY